MAGVRNLTQLEAAERARLLDVEAYDISLDLTDGTGGPGDRTFRSTTRVTFTCTEPGAATFIEVAADRMRSVRLNGTDVDTSAWSAESGLALPGLAAANTLEIDADFLYSSSGQGLHRSVDPVDKEVYLYSQFETADAQRVFACFDQPDLKSVFTWRATVPAHWRVISNSPAERIEPGDVEGSKVVHFGESVRMSTYVTALCAGPYHEVREAHDGIDLGLFIRDSMKQYLDADDLFLVTRQGFDFFHEQFGVRYPLPKYDQVFVTDFNAGAMENFGCVVHGEEYYIFRSQVTDFEYENRANTILHEMAHMWFGDLVTMRWWDDIWLNESFAEWASHWCNAKATRFSDAWTTFLSVRKNWGYRQDQLSSTHPVYAEMPDVESVEVNFDGITYAKGASVIKQIVAYVGIDAFVAGLRAYFAAHAWGNATFDDLLSALEDSSRKPLREFAAQWLETAQVNTLRPVVEIGPGGRYSSVDVIQQAPTSYPTLRTHRIAIGLYDRSGDQLARRDRVDVVVSGPSTRVEQLAGVRAADVLLVNDDDLTYAKLRLDERSMSTVVDHLSGFESSLTRALCWSAAWDMTRDAEMSTRDYVALVLSGIASVKDISVAQTVLRQARQATQQYADPAWRARGLTLLASGLRSLVADAEPGSDHQLAYVNALATVATSADDLAFLSGLLDGSTVLDGLTVDADLRWTLTHALVSGGVLGEEDIAHELLRDSTATGERSATLCRAAIPTAEGKAKAWATMTEGKLSGALLRSSILGFMDPRHADLLEPYATRYFDEITGIWETWTFDSAQNFAVGCYPALAISPATVARTQDLISSAQPPQALRRLLLEGADGVSRALRAQAKDAASA